MKEFNKYLEQVYNKDVIQPSKKQLQQPSKKNKVFKEDEEIEDLSYDTMVEKIEYSIIYIYEVLHMEPGAKIRSRLTQAKNLLEQACEEIVDPDGEDEFDEYEDFTH